MRFSSFKATTLVCALVAAFAAGIILYSNYSSIASYAGLTKPVPTETAHDLDSLLW